MSEQKNKLNNLPPRSRVKKYDMYQSRKVGSLSQSMNGSNKFTVRHGTLPVSPQNNFTNVDLSKNQHQKNSIVSNQSSVNSRTTNQQNSSQHLRVDNRRSQPQQLKNSNRVALHSVATAQIYDNEVYPDNGNTVYGTLKRKKTLFQKLTYGFALIVLVFSAFVSIQSFITNNKAQDQIATLGEAVGRDEQGVSEGTGNEPSEEPVPESVVRNYQVSNPEDPRFLRIPSLGVFARIKNLGITPEGAVDAPRNIYDTGWYSGSARPGSSFGSSLILGHVSGWSGPGVFKKINELPVGGEFEVEKGTGEIIKYSVTRSEQIPVDQIDMGKILSTEVAGKHDLKLMTCSGRYNSATETFEDRFIVYAKKI